jgi:hypothetical protein
MPNHRLAFATSPVRAALGALVHQPGSLQRLLHPAIAEFNLVFGKQLFMKVPHTEIKIALLIKLEHLLGQFHRNPVDTALASTLVEQSRVSVRLVFGPLPLHIPHAHAGDLSRFNPGDLFGHCLENYVLQFHHPLHLRGRQALTRVHLVSVLLLRR